MVLEISHDHICLHCHNRVTEKSFRCKCFRKDPWIERIVMKVR